MLTDANGQVTVTDLMEGAWQWKTSAPGHGATQGVVTVVPNQTVGVASELWISMVTVKFSVVPVAFTDYYEIKLEQTFQTRTPIPNMVLSPPHQTLRVEAGWSGTLLYTLRNEGLRSAFGVVISGGDMPTMRATPLVTYIPELLAQQTVEIPIFFEYFGPTDETAAGAGLANVVRSISDAITSGKAISDLPIAPPRAASAQPGSISGGSAVPTRAAGAIDTAKDIYDCYKNMKYGVITLKAAAYIDCVTGTQFNLGVNATIDVDALLAFVCDGECPDSWFGSGLIGTVGKKLCDKALEKIDIKGKVKVIDIVCKAANIIKAIACALAQLPTSQGTSSIGSGVGGGGTAGAPGNFGGGAWAVASAGCFVAGTPVTMPDGTTKPIELLGKGDRLLASSTGQTDIIAQVMILSSDHLRELTFHPRETANAPEMKLRLTHDHHVWVDGRGWVFSVDVKVGDWLHGVDGKLHEVTGNERLPGHHEVYGLHMDNDTVIYAGGVLTKDQCFKPAPSFRFSPQKEIAR